MKVQRRVGYTLSRFAYIVPSVHKYLLSPLRVFVRSVVVRILFYCHYTKLLTVNKVFIAAEGGAWPVMPMRETSATPRHQRDDNVGHSELKRTTLLLERLQWWLMHHGGENTYTEQRKKTPFQSKISLEANYQPLWLGNQFYKIRGIRGRIFSMDTTVSTVTGKWPGRPQQRVLARSALETDFFHKRR